MRTLLLKLRFVKYPLLFLMLSGVLLLPGMSVSASGGLPSARVLLKRIDWTHPVRVQQVSVPSGRGTDLVPNSVPLYIPPKAGLAVQPHANFPGNCWQGYAYYVIVNGATHWSLSSLDGKHAAWTAYMWCPTYSGDPVGINWSFGKAYVTGCTNVYVGGTTGAVIAERTSGLTYDGEAEHAIWTCNTYAWDDSLTVIGSGLYKVFMNADYFDINLIIVAQSPCYC